MLLACFIARVRRVHGKQKGRGLRFRSFTRPGKEPVVGHRAIPQGAGFLFRRVLSPVPAFRACPARGTPEADMDKDRKEALQAAKELTAKFIETRTVSPGNFAEIFPAVYRVVYAAIRENADETEGTPA